MDDERGYKSGDEDGEREEEGEGEIGEVRELEDWQGWRIISIGELEGLFW